MADETTLERDTGDIAEAPVRRVLVVDDDAGIRMLLQVTIEMDERFELAGAAGSTEEVLALIAAGAPGHIDLVLVDVTLPDGDGVDLVRELRSILPDAGLALYTGWTDTATSDRAKEAGADRVFSKSLEPQTLLSELLAIAPAR